MKLAPLAIAAAVAHSISGCAQFQDITNAQGVPAAAKSEHSRQLHDAQVHARMCNDLTHKFKLPHVGQMTPFQKRQNATFLCNCGEPDQKAAACELLEAPELRPAKR